MFSRPRNTGYVYIATSLVILGGIAALVLSSWLVFSALVLFSASLYLRWRAQK